MTSATAALDHVLAGWPRRSTSWCSTPRCTPHTGGQMSEGDAAAAPWPNSAKRRRRPRQEGIFLGLMASLRPRYVGQRGHGCLPGADPAGPSWRRSRIRRPFADPGLFPLHLPWHRHGPGDDAQQRAVTRGAGCSTATTPRRSERGENPLQPSTCPEPKLRHLAEAVGGRKPLPPAWAISHPDQARV